MRLVRLKPQVPGSDRGPDRPVQRKFTKYSTTLGLEISREKICGLLKCFLQRGPEGPAVAFMPQVPEEP